MNAEVLFQPLSESDLPLLHDWIHRPHISCWWGADGPPPTLAATIQKYLPRLTADSPIKPYIAYRSGQRVGFIQSYIAVACGNGWWAEETDAGVMGIDQFLSDESNLGRGIGTTIVAQFVDRLFADPTVTRVQTDPNPTNARAIRCYEKVGFRALRLIDTPSGRALLMAIDRGAFRRQRAA